MNQNLFVENNEEQLKKMIEEIAGKWPQLKGAGDPNTQDHLYLACKIVENLKLKLPTTLSDIETGMLLIDVMSKNFSMGLIRDVPPNDLAIRGIALSKEIQKQNLLPYTPIENFVISLFTYHGYFCMSKTTRRFYNTPFGHKEYTDEIRKNGYASLKEDWEKAEARRNPWVRYGVTITKSFIEKYHKKEDIVTNWIPKDSPYWDSIKN